jgi:hypothetical protein
MTTRSYSDLSDSATTFDPEEQFDRDIDERMKGMSKEEAVGVALRTECMAIFGATWSYDNAWRFARIAIAAADKWDAEQVKCNLCESSNGHRFSCVTIQRDYIDGGAASVAISPGQDSAIQDELDHPPASIMEEGK